MRSASTGAPVALGDIADSVDVLAVVSRGRASSASGSARLELVLSGRSDTMLVASIEAPVPVVIAHAFRLVASRAAGGLRDGNYRARVRLVGGEGRSIAESVPIFLTVRAR